MMRISACPRQNVYLGDDDSILGDVNVDLVVNVLDVVLLVHLVLSNSEISFSSDLNVDGELNVLDVVQLVNLILF